MRTFYFKAKTIGQEKYLTYTMGEDCELDEDILDYCEENKPVELVGIIYEEDEDYDYLTYDVTDMVTIAERISKVVSSNDVLLMIRNIANSLISLKEQNVQLGYILLNREFSYVDSECNIKFLCVPVENKGSVVTEFKGYIRELIANMIFNIEEDLGYVGKLLTYINGDNFNLRGLVGLSEALMEEAGVSFEATSGIETDAGEVVAAEPELTARQEGGVADFMSSESDTDEPLPEIGDDEDEDEETQPVVNEIPKVEIKTEAKEEAEVESKDETVPEVKEEPKSYGIKDPKDRETDLNVLKSRMNDLVGNTPKAEPKLKEDVKTINSIDELDSFLNKAPVVKKNVVKVNRAALIQSAAEHEGDDQGDASKGTTANLVQAISSDMNVEKDSKPKSNSILSRTVELTTSAPTLMNAPKAVPYLIRVNTDERIMLNKDSFKLGKATRGVDYSVGGNGAISRQHAIIIQKDGVCYIKDNKSTNHTFVNDKIVDEGIEEILTHDSIIRLGDEEFRFKIR